MQINQDGSPGGGGQNSRGVRKYVGPVQVAVQELDGWFSYNFALEQVRGNIGSTSFDVLF